MDDLISREAMLDEFHSLCGPQTGDGWDNMGVRSLIMRQKAVDAIPVEWIMSWSNKRYQETQMDVSIVDVLEAWQKKQEAQDG